MENFLTPKERPEEIKFLVDFVRSNELSDYTTLSEMRDKIKGQYAAEFSDLENTAKEDFMRKLEGFSFYSLDVQEADRSMMNTLSRFRDEVLAFIKKGLNDKTYELKRQVSPPLEAYNNVGHNKLNLKPTGRGFGLSFE